jgi:hypothetical protein
VAGNATLAEVPVTGGQVVQHQLQAIGIEPGFDVFRGKGVGEEELHRPEP